MFGAVLPKSVDLRECVSLVSGVALAASVCFLYFGTGWLRKRVTNGRCKTTNNDQSDRVLLHQAVNLEHQSKMLPGPERIRVSVLDNGGKAFESTDPDVSTLYENFLLGKRLSNDGQCLGHRSSVKQPFQWLSYSETLTQAHQLGAGLIDLGLEPGAEKFIAIYSQNRPEWVISSLAAMSYSFAVVPLYDTLGADAAQFIINQAEIEVVICDSIKKADKLLQGGQNRLKTIIFTRNVSPAEIAEAAKNTHVKLHSFEDVLMRGQQHRHPLLLPRPDDLYMICYTSGTTGQPKGVMLTHRNLLSNAATSTQIFHTFQVKIVRPGDATISYLPLAHMFEQMVHVLMFSYGGKIGIFQGDINHLLDDLKELKPQCFPAVPRLLNRLYDKVQSELSNSRLKRVLFERATASKLAEMRQGLIRKDSLWDKLVFSKIQRELGGNVNLIVTGSAPVRAEILSLTRAMLGCLVLEAYGQTECTAAATITMPTDLSSGHVGGPVPCCQVKLVDVPELDYKAGEDVGEVCVRGPSVTSGYFRDPARTAEILDQDGWLHTGDIGRWMPNGVLKIIDRKKHIFKLAQGEYVAPEKIENVYLRSPLIAQVFVDGDSLQRHLVAVLVPDERQLRQLLRHEAENRTLQQLCEDRAVAKAVLTEVNKTGKQLGLNSIELVKAVHLTSEPFTIQNGLLTPTMKSKRPQLRRHFADTIRRLYAEG